MKDTIAVGTVAGTLGTVALNLLTYLVKLAGVKTGTPWDVASALFLNSQFMGTASWYVVGFAGSLALGVACGIATTVLIKITGHDYAWLKGVLVAEAFGFAGLGFFVPLLGVSISLKNQPATNIFALINLFLFGILVGYFIKRVFTLGKLR